MSNTQVTFSGDCWTTPSAMSYDVRGYGNFISGSGFLARVTQPISNVTVECRRSQTMNGFTCSASSASLSVDVSTDWIMSGMNSSSLVSAGTARINIGRNCSIGSASVVPIQINGGGLFFNGNISCGLGPSVLFYFDSGSLTISNSDIVTSAMAGPAIGGPGGGLIRIDNVDINSNISQPFSIVTLSPTLQVVCKNSSVNVPVDATTIQVIGNLQYDLLSFPSLGQVPTVNTDGTWEWAGLPSSAVLAGNVVIVDAVNGNDSTGVAGDLAKPFLTLLAAQTAASAGQTIVVYPGTYTSSSSLGKNGVNWHFMLGAIVNFTGGSAWSPSTTAVTFKVSGDGEFVCSGFLVQCILLGPNNINIECLNASYTSIDMTNGVVNIKIKGLAQASAETAFFGDSLTFSAAKLQSAVATHVFTQYSNTINIVDTYFELSGIGGACRKNSFGGFFNLRNVYITGGSAALFANIGGTFYCQNVVSNTGVSPLVVIDGNMQVLSGPATAGQVPTANADGTWSWA